MRGLSQRRQYRGDGSWLRETPHPAAMLCIASTLSHKGRGKKRDYGAIVIGEKSTNQLLACTKFLIFGLIARGATS
jgi:hypothetical protein